VDTLTRCNCFVSAVESGSFSGDSAIHDLNSPRVSKQISRLEDRLGARLFNRTTRQLAPTEEAAPIMSVAKRILCRIQKPKAAVHGNSTPIPRGVFASSTCRCVWATPYRAHLESFWALSECLEWSFRCRTNSRIRLPKARSMLVRVGEIEGFQSDCAESLARGTPVIAATPGYWKKPGARTSPKIAGAIHCLTYSYLSRRQYGA